METANNKFYVKPSDRLEQGDIFKLEIVAPAADHRQRLLRTTDGQHGSVVFEGGIEGTVFDPSDLHELLASTSKTDWHTFPFEKAPDGQAELVVVHAELIEYFIIATQTCDVTGEDEGRPPLEATMILPIRTLASICQLDRFPFLKDDGATLQDMTIHEYVVSRQEAACLSSELSPLEYGNELRGVLGEWKPAKKEPVERKNVGRIKELLNAEQSRGFVYWIQADHQFDVPECCVDFTAIYTVPRGRLLDLSDRRIARISSPYREQFAKAFADRISRVATSASIHPPKLR